MLEMTQADTVKPSQGGCEISSWPKQCGQADCCLITACFLFSCCSCNQVVRVVCVSFCLRQADRAGYLSAYFFLIGSLL